MKKNFSQLINTENPILIDFFAEWCAPCKMMPPILAEVKQQMGDKVTIIKMDVDKNPDLAQQLHISGVPTLMLFKDGQTLWRQSGVVPAAQLVKVLEQYA